MLDVYVCVMYIYFSPSKARWTNWVDAELYRVYSHFQNVFNFHWHFMAVKTFTKSMMMSSNGNFPLNWPFVRGIHRPPVNSPHKGEWCGALTLSLICARIKQSRGWWFETPSHPLWRHCNVVKSASLSTVCYEVIFLESWACVYHIVNCKIYWIPCWSS